MRVFVTVDEIELEGDYAPVDSLEVTCERCGYSVEVFGMSEASERAACAKLREECPEGESNFYDVLRAEAIAAAPAVPAAPTYADILRRLKGK